MSGRRLFWILMPLLLVALVAEACYASRRWRAGNSLGMVETTTLQLRAQGLLARRPLDPRVRRLMDRNVALLRQAEQLDPVEVGIPIARGSLYLIMGREKAAIRAYEEALELEQKAEIYANLGRVHLQLGDEEAAREAFRLAVRLNHNLAKDFRAYIRDADEPPKRRPGKRRKGKPAADG